MAGLFSILNLGILFSKRLTGEARAGRRGERSVEWRLRWLPNEYFVINDLMLNRGGGYTSQIDHVVVSPYGIFVIETKNISGYIYGRESSKKWKRIWRGWYYGIMRSDEMEFDNPILQNEAHIKALAEIVGNNNVKYISIVAFTSNATLRVTSEHNYVVYTSQVRRLIRSFSEPIMSLEQVKHIYYILSSINVTDNSFRVQHAERAQMHKSTYEQKQKDSVTKMKCPSCGGTLIKRHGAYGYFYGCSNYPQCKYICQIK